MVVTTPMAIVLIKGMTVCWITVYTTCQVAPQLSSSVCTDMRYNSYPIIIMQYHKGCMLLTPWRTDELIVQEVNLHELYHTIHIKPMWT